ncbi:hypothetical protein UFOVP115_53 [uncultured Caudovirales phage]|uniref:Uncharacterized protein n=1 Tax=uncultured Caudovirales phage TaxID=2100421 RepID=A0A6J5L6B4_9CAUD|nr:hypothetical protein UFOVP115_53 [uncultured Caudovirales phage]
MPIHNEDTPAEYLEPLRKEVQQYVFLKDEITSLDTRVSQIKKRITSTIEELGEANDKGSLVLPINDDKSGVTSVVKQRRVSKVFDEDTANQILKDKNLFDDCTQTITVLNQDAVMSAYYNGLLTDEDIEVMFPEKVSWALILEKK